MTWIDRFRLQPPPAPVAPPARDLALEALRGLCALAVLYAHVFMPKPVLDPQFSPSPRFWWFDLGSAAVLLFFVMSGYVIGLTVRRPLTGPDLRAYLQRRALRIVPVAYAAILLSWFLRHWLDGRIVAAHFLFLQNMSPYPVTGWQIPPLSNNPALWTLNYEVLYYLLFIPVWWLGPPLSLIVVLLTALTFGPALGLPVPAMIAAHACGAYYWVGGLGLAWFTPPAEATRRSHWPSALLGAYALWRLGILRSLLLAGGADSLLWLVPTSPHRLDFLPACLWCILAVTGRAPSLQKTLAGACLAWGWFGVIRSAVSGEWPETHWPAALALLAATGLIAWRPALASLGRLAPLGTISFGIYAFGVPVQTGLCNFFPGYSGTVLTYTLRLLAAVLLTLGLAWLLDRRLYGWLSARRRGHR